MIFSPKKGTKVSILWSRTVEPHNPHPPPRPVCRDSVYLQAGLSGRVPVIQARIRADGRDFDDHISEFIRVGLFSIKKLNQKGFTE